MTPPIDAPPFADGCDRERCTAPAGGDHAETCVAYGYEPPTGCPSEYPDECPMPYTCPVHDAPDELDR